MRDPDREEVHVGRSGALQIVARFEVALGSAEIGCGQGDEVATVETNYEICVLVANLIGKGLPDGDVADGIDDLPARPRLLYAHCDGAGVGVVEFCYRFRRNGIVHVDLSNAGRSAGLCDRQSGREPVDGAVRIPAAGVRLSKLGAAMVRVGSRHTAAGRHLHNQSAVPALGKKVIVVLKPTAALQLGAAHGHGAARSTIRQLKAPFGESKLPPGAQEGFRL